MAETELLRWPEDQNQSLDSTWETAQELLSRLDDEAIQDLAETGTVEDVRAVVELLIQDNPELRPYLAEFQQANSEALANELRRVAQEEVADTHEWETAEQELSESEAHEYIQQAQNYLYESLDIDENLANNGALTNFAKGIVDTLIFENADLAVQVIETKGQVILDALKQLATWKGIKQVLQALWESIWDLFSGDAYEKGKAVADLWLVATGVGVSATLGRKVVKTTLKHLETPSVRNLDRDFIEDIAKLPDSERLEAAWVFLGREIPENQRQAILEAHNVGERLEDGTYSLWDLREKTRVLRESGFTDEEIRTLFDNNICGKEFPESRKLLDNPKYSFLNTEPYRELREMLWDIDASDLLWEWQNAIILKHPNNSERVLKIAKPWAIDDLMSEFKNHQRFYDVLEQWRLDFPWQLSDNIRIPRVTQWKWDTRLYFEMEKIDWQSFRSEYYRWKYEPQFNSKYSSEVLDSFTDAQIESLVWDLWLQHIPSRVMDWDHWWKIAVNESQRYMWGQISKNWQETALWNVLSFLYWKDLKHTDMHAGNFMRAKDGTIYIIDFWNVTIK